MEWQRRENEGGRGLSLSLLIQLYKASLRGRTTTLYCHLRGELSSLPRILTLLTVTRTLVRVEVRRFPGRLLLAGGMIFFKLLV